MISILMKKNNYTAGRQLAEIKEDKSHKRSKKDIFLYSSLLLFILSSITGIILFFIIASLCFLIWVLYAKRD